MQDLDCVDLGGEFAGPKGIRDEPGVLFVLVMFLCQSLRLSDSTLCGHELDFGQLCLSLVV